MKNLLLICRLVFVFFLISLLPNLFSFFNIKKEENEPFIIPFYFIIIVIKYINYKKVWVTAFL